MSTDASSDCMRYEPTSQLCMGGCGRTSDEIADAVRWYVYAACFLLIIFSGVAFYGCS